MKRSTFIYLSIAGSATVGVSSLACSRRNEALTKILRQPQFLSQICDVKTLTGIGKAYKEKFPSEGKENELANMLLTDSTGNILPKTSTKPVIDLLLNRKVEQEFETGKTVVVNGWVLSRTEAQQCALFYLS